MIDDQNFDHTDNNALKLIIFRFEFSSLYMKIQQYIDQKKEIYFNIFLLLKVKTALMIAILKI